MSKKSLKNLKKVLALGMTLALVCSVTGCGKDGVKVSGDGERGRYVEQRVELPEGVQASDIRQVGKTEQGQLFLLEMKKQEEKPVFAEYVMDEKQEMLVRAENDWLEKILLPSAPWSLGLLHKADGKEILFVVYGADEEAGNPEAYWGHLFTTDEEGNVTEITPKGWKEPIDTDGYAYFDTPSAVSLSGDSVIGYFWDRLEFYQADTGELTGEMPLSGSYMEMIPAGKDGFYLGACSDMGYLQSVEKYQNGQTQPAETIPFTSEASAGGMLLDVLEDGTLIAAGDASGFSMCAPGQTEWQQVIPLRFTSLSMPTMYCIGMAAMENGTFYAMYQAEEEAEAALMKYVYDKEAPTKVEKTLKVYTVNESTVLKYAAAMFQREHPEVEIKVETVLTYEDTYAGNADMNSIYTQLNAKLLAGEAADILVLDGLNKESFVEKGLLLNLDDVITPMEEAGELLTNITGGYRQEDGSVYMVPLRFAMTLLVGRDVDAESISDMQSMEQVFDTKAESVLGTRTVQDLVAEFSPYFMEEVVHDKALDKEALAQYLTWLKAIGDNCGMVEDYGESWRAPGIWEIASNVHAAMYEADGFKQCMLPISAARLVNGSVTCFENTYIPKFEAGIYSQTKEPELAKEFLQFALSLQVQNTDFYDGFPINAQALEKQAVTDRSHAEAYTGIALADGSSMGFDIKDFDKDQSAQLVAMCRALNRRAVYDGEVNTKLTEAFAGYLTGNKTIEETIEQAEAGLRMYLAE